MTMTAPSPRRLSITAMGARGEGIAEVDGARLFVPFALPGEEIAATVSHDHTERAILADLITASPDRVVAPCPHFGACGGCLLQHWAEAPYRAWKRALVIDALAREGLKPAVSEVVDVHGAGRRRAVFHIRWALGKAIAGFMAPRSHRLIAIDHCPILVPALAGAGSIVARLAAPLHALAKPIDAQVTASATGLDIDLRGTGLLGDPVRLALSRLAERLDLARLTLHGERIIERRPPRVTVAGIALTLPPGGFLQATEAGEAALSAAVAGALAGARTVADLFCGVGPFALSLARSARIAAYDADAGAIAALEGAARTTQGLKPVVAERRDLMRRPLLKHELAAFDAVVLDPPRAGAEAQARELAKSSVKRIAYVSCDPGTFARDAAILAGAGFEIDGVLPFDQFRYSAHIELVACFQRR